MSRVSWVVALLSACWSVPAVAAPVTIDGVPRIDYQTKRYSQHLAAAWASLAAQGCLVPYEEVMVASGAAFRIAWWPGHYSYAAAELAPEDLVLNGAEAVGAIAERRQHATEEEAWQTVVECIDAGRAPCVWCGWGSQVVAGYDDPGMQMLVRHYNTPTEQLKTTPFEAAKPPWPLTSSFEVVVLEYELEGDEPDLEWEHIISRAIDFADWPADDPLYGTFTFGLGAYDSWAQTLRGGLDENGAKTNAVQCEFMARSMADARGCAAVVLQGNAGDSEAFADAAFFYQEEADTLAKMADVLADGTTGAWSKITQAMIANFPRQEVREAAAQLVEQAREQELLAIDSLRDALAEIQGGGDEPADEGVPPPDDGAETKAKVDELLRRGKQLKTARRFAEAEGALREALKLDPENVETHWVLGWVLVELKRTDDAVAEFNTVIKLAPDTGRAREAQKAIDRLKQ